MPELQRSSGVLIVEGEPLGAMHVAAVLADLGCGDVRFASTLAAAVRLLSTRRFGLGILDADMDEDLVFCLAAELHTRRIPMIFSSVLARRAVPPKWARHLVLPRPIDRGSLAAALVGLGLILPTVLGNNDLSGRDPRR